MRKAIWAVLPILVGCAGAQEKIDLKNTPLPLNQMGGGMGLRPTDAAVTAPSGFMVKATYTLNFAGVSHLVALGTFRGRSAAVVDLTGKDDLSRSVPYMETRGDGHFVYYGPFEVTWNVGGRPCTGKYRLISMLQPGMNDLAFWSACGAPTGHGTILGRPVAVKLFDGNYDGKFDGQDYMSVDWGGVKRMLSLGSGIGVGKRFARFKVDPLGTTLEVVPVSAATTDVRVDADAVEGESTGPPARRSDHWLIEGIGGVLSVPTGTQLYSIAATRLYQGKKWTLGLARPSYRAPGQPDPVVANQVALEPLTVGLTQDEQGSTRTFSLTLHAPGDLRVSGLAVDGKAPDAPVLELHAADGSVVDAPKFTYG